MKLPQVFMPQKDLEKSIEELLVQSKYALKESPVLFEDLDIEPTAEDYRYHFCTSLKRLKEAGYERHLRPWESFDLITEHLENRLPPDLDVFVKIRTGDYDEWLSIALERNRDVLLCFVDPENLKQNKNGLKYFFDGTLRYNYALSKELSVKNIPSGTFVPLDQFSDEFVKYFYNRKFKELPKEMREGAYKAHVYLPPEGVLWPASRGCLVNRFYLYTYCTYASSSGVRRHRKETR